MQLVRGKILRFFFNLGATLPFGGQPELGRQREHMLEPLEPLEERKPRVLEPRLELLEEHRPMELVQLEPLERHIPLEQQREQLLEPLEQPTEQRGRPRQSANKKGFEEGMLDGEAKYIRFFKIEYKKRKEQNRSLSNTHSHTISNHARTHHITKKLINFAMPDVKLDFDG